MKYYQGKKMRDLKKLTLETGVKVDFADPIIAHGREVSTRTQKGYSDSTSPKERI